MTFAILADIHGNSAALRAVLSDMRDLGIKEAVNLGDHFSGPLDAAGTAEILMGLEMPSILGNHDRWLIEMAPEDMYASDRVAFDQLGEAELEWLRAQPGTLRYSEEVFLCHGAPASDTQYWLERVDENGAVRPATLAEIEREAEGIDASLILCGHTHMPRAVRLAEGRMIVNPGSIGCPGYDDDTPVFHIVQNGTPNASYAIADKTAHGWLITHRSVPYDTAPMVAMAEAHGRDEWARALATGWLEA
ncbi:MAG: metallophosphoesterase family protein [Pseudomonadota bacterium]